MDFKNLQKELFEKKFKLDEYMGNTFDIFGSIVKENKLWIAILVILNIWALYSTTLQNTINTNIRVAASYGDVSNMARYSGMQLSISLFNTVISVYSTLFSIRMYSKVVMKIEGRENEYSFKETFFKFLKIFGLIIVFLAVFSIVMFIPVLIGIFIGIIAELFESSYGCCDCGSSHNLDSNCNYSVDKTAVFQRNILYKKYEDSTDVQI